MYLFKIWQIANDDYNTYDSAVVVAENENEAIGIHPNSNREDWDGKADDEWCDMDCVNVEFLGEASIHLSPGVVVASFNPS